MNGSSSSMATSGSSTSSPARARRSTASRAGSSGRRRRRCRPRRAARAGRSSPKSTVGAVSSTPYASSGPVHHPLSPTMIAPRSPPPTAPTCTARLLTLGERDPVALRHAVLARRAPPRSARPRAGSSAKVTVCVGEHEVRPVPELLGRCRASTSTRLRGRWTKTSTSAPSTSSVVRSNGAPGPQQRGRLLRREPVVVVPAEREPDRSRELQHPLRVLAQELRPHVVAERHVRPCRP